MMQSQSLAGVSNPYHASDRPRQGADSRSSDRPETPHSLPDALFASTSGQGQRPYARQLPPGAGYASDHAQLRVDLAPSTSTVFASTASPSSYTSPATPLQPSWQTAHGSGDLRMPSPPDGDADAFSGALEREAIGGTGSSGGRRATDTEKPGNHAAGPSTGVSLANHSTSREYVGKPSDEPAPWSISLQEPTPPPSQHFSGASTDLRPDPGSRRPSGGTPGETVNYSRPNSTFAFAATGTKTPTSATGELSSSSDAPTVRSPERPPYAQRDSFVGIPGGRTPVSTREASMATERQSRIPTFEPAISFSPQERGPYPPVSASPTRAHQVQQNDAEVRVDRKTTYSPVMSGAPELPPTDAGRPGSLAFDASAFSSDLAGIGRNSVIRAAASPPLFATTSSPLEQLGSGLAGSGGAQGAARTQAPVVQMSPQAVLVSQQAQASPGQPFSFPNSNINAALARPSPPPHLVPQPEICVECMMRDRDMADVDVTTPGVWERTSDADYDEQMRWEAETAHEAGGPSTGTATPATSSWSGEHTGSVESAAAASKRRESGTAQSRESLGGRSSLAHGNPAHRGRKRLGRGQLLTSGNLKVWTTMNPPAAAHRWRTLQTYLATQAHYLELDRQGREAEHSQSLPVRPTQHAVRPSQGSRSWSSTGLSPAAEKSALEQEAQSRRAGKPRNLSRGTLGDETNRLSSASLLPPPVGSTGASARRANVVSSGASMRSYSSGDQPWLGNQLRRISTSGGRDGPQAESPQAHRFIFSPFTRSATDLRVMPSPRSVSPARTSDDRRTSTWSRFRQSGTASVLSFAPSGSMLDMHLGLSQDKHMPYASHAPYETYPSRSDPAVARHAEDARRAQALAASQATGESSGGKKKKKGIKGFFNKLVSGPGSSKKAAQLSVSAPPTPGADGPYDESLDDSELAPPPPLSALVNEPHYHQRSVSSSSVDSFGPVTPPVPGGSNFRFGGSQGFETGSLRMPADRQSMASFNSARSRPLLANGPDSLRNGGAWPSADSLRDPTFIDPGEHEVLASADEPPSQAGPGPRPHKSLPLLPSEDPYASRPPLEAYRDPNLPLAPPNAPYAHYGASRSSQSFEPPTSQTNFVEEFGYDARPTSTGSRDRRATVTGDGRSIHKARSRSKIFSMSFGKKGKQAENIPPPLPHPNLRANSLDSGVALGAGARSPYSSGYM